MLAFITVKYFKKITTKIIIIFQKSCFIITSNYVNIISINVNTFREIILALG